MENLPQRLGIDPSLLDLWEQLDSDTQAATALVFVCHAGHGWDLGKHRNIALKWWSEFLPERVTLAALTSGTLAEFGAELCRRLRGQVGSRWRDGGEAHRQVWTELIGLPEGRQRRVLDVLETQASVCVTLIRANADARKQRGDDGAKERDDRERGVGDGGPDLFAGAEPVSVPGEAGVGGEGGPPL